eukprot:symbB.v1.2.021716.t1/scaffold1893.1/size96936/1
MEDSLANGHEDASRGRSLLGFAGFAGAGVGLLFVGPTAGLMLSSMAIHAVCRDDRAGKMARQLAMKGSQTLQQGTSELLRQYRC